MDGGFLQSAGVYVQADSACAQRRATAGRSSDCSPPWIPAAVPDVTIGNVPPVAQASRRVPGRASAWPQPAYALGRVRPELEDVAVLQAWAAPTARQQDRRQPTGRASSALPELPLLDSSALPPATAQARPMPHRGAGRGRCEGGEPIRYQEEERAYLPLPTESIAPRRHARGGRAGGVWTAAPEPTLTLPWLPCVAIARPPLRLPGLGQMVGQQLPPSAPAAPVPAALVAGGRGSPPTGRVVAGPAPLDWLLVQLAGPAAPQASVALAPCRSKHGAGGRQLDNFLVGVNAELQRQYVAAWSAPSPAQARDSKAQSGRNQAAQVITQEQAGPVPVVPFQAWAGPAPRGAVVRGSAEGSMPPPVAAGLVVVTGPFELFAYDVYWAGAVAGEIEEV